jgi:hypothetical protein
MPIAGPAPVATTPAPVIPPLPALGAGSPGLGAPLGGGWAPAAPGGAALPTLPAGLEPAPVEDRLPAGPDGLAAEDEAPPEDDGAPPEDTGTGTVMPRRLRRGGERRPVARRRDADGGQSRTGRGDHGGGRRNADRRSVCPTAHHDPAAGITGHRPGRPAPAGRRGRRNLTDRHALALGNGTALLDNRIQPAATVAAPAF